MVVVRTLPPSHKHVLASG